MFYVNINVYLTPHGSLDSNRKLA